MEVSQTLELEYQVTQTDLAKTLSIDEQDDFPEVLATSRMIALMELAAARLMKGLLSEEELSVGVNVNVTHMAATLQGDTVRVLAKYTGMEGKLYQFNVSLYDAGGIAGEGTHTRAIVKTSRLLQGAKKRANG
jgi:predicted thioesterase